MAMYEKTVTVLGHDIKLKFHGIAESVISGRHYPSAFKVFDDFIGEQSTQRSGTYGAKVISHQWTEYNSLLVSYGNIVSLGPISEADHYELFWSDRAMITMPSSGGNVSINRTVYVGYELEEISGYSSRGSFIAPMDDTHYGFNNVSLPNSIDIYGVAYFESNDDLLLFVEKWNEGNLDTSLIKNIGEDTDQEEYNGAKQYWFINTYQVYTKGSSGRYDVKAGSGQVKVVFEETDKRLYFTNNPAKDKNLILKNYSGVSCDYSTNKGFTSWTTVDSMPSSLAGVVRGGLKDGAAVISGTLSTNIPIFSNVEKGEDYEGGFIDSGEADNANQLDDGNSPAIKDGENETTTTLGSTVAMDKMTMYYKLTPAQLANFGATLFNEDNQETVIAGTKLVGQDALNALIGLRYYPFDISRVCGTTGAYYINLGSWGSGCASSGVITSNTGVIDIGNMAISPLFHSFLDYTNIGLSVWLPYVGMRDIDVKSVMGKVLSIKYVVDVTTGKCKAMLFADGLLFDSHEGVIARDCPISGVDAQAYNSAIRGANIASNNASLSGLNAITSAATSGISAGASGNPYSMASGLLGGLAGSIGTAKNYGLMMDQAAQDKVNAKNNLPTHFIGSSGGQLAELEPQYVYLIYSVNKVHMPSNEVAVIGRPSNTSGNVGQFYGFLSCDLNKIETKATASERAMISSLLASGIYI